MIAYDVIVFKNVYFQSKTNDSCSKMNVLKLKKVVLVAVSIDISDRSITTNSSEFNYRQFFKMSSLGCHWSNNISFNKRFCRGNKPEIEVRRGRIRRLRTKSLYLLIKNLENVSNISFLITKNLRKISKKSLKTSNTTENRLKLRKYFPLLE